MSTSFKNPISRSRAPLVAALINAPYGRLVDERAAGKESV